MTFRATRPHGPLRVLLLVLAGSAIVPAAAARAQSGLQITPDERRTLISKDVGEERWAIALNRDDDSVSGNVFFSTGEPPRFVWCSSLVPGSDPLELECSVADACTAVPCAGGWLPVGIVRLPRGFFLPRASDAAAAAARALARAAGGGGRASGVQISPDARRVLVSKDVNEQRWIITLNLDDRTVTGNVFVPGEAPSFVWCTQEGIADGEVTLSCRGAANCEGGSCSGDDWIFVSDVTLPAAFLRPPAPGGDARTACLDTARAGDVASASFLCGAAADADPDDGLVALVRAVADPLAAAFESARALDLLVELGLSVRGSAFDVCQVSVRRTPVETPPPRAAAIQAVAAAELLRVVEIARTRLADVPLDGGIAVASPDLPPCLRGSDATIAEVDATDVRAVSALVDLLEALAHASSGYDLDFDVGAAIDEERSFGDVFRAEPALLTLRPAGEAALGRARDALDRALESYVATIDLARAESDDQADDVLVLDPADEDVETSRDVAERLRTALSGTATFDGELLDLDTSQRLRLAPLFDGDLDDLRALLPIGESGDGDFCALPDPTFGGVTPDLTQEQFDRLLDRSCEG